MTRPEKEIVRLRRGIEEVEKFAEGVWIKSWGNWSEWGWMGSYSGEGSSISSPPPSSPPPPQFTKEEDRGKWEDISAAIKFVAGNNGDGGGGGSVEGRWS